MMAEGDEREDPFIRAWEERTERELNETLGPIFRAHGHGFPGSQSRSVARAEQRRVTDLLGRDRAYRAQEDLRTAALAQVENGEYANIRDSVSGPTPEQIAQAERSGGGFRRFTPRGEAGTVRTVTAFRRKDLPQVARLEMSGTIDATGFRDCLWYRSLHDRTGLAGNIASIDYGREVFVAPQDRAMFADHQLEAQDTFRFVRANIAAVRLSLLDQVVLEDVPIYAAQRIIGAGWRSARRIFAAAVADLHSARELSERAA